MQKFPTMNVILMYDKHVLIKIRIKQDNPPQQQQPPKHLEN